MQTVTVALRQVSDHWCAVSNSRDDYGVVAVGWGITDVDAVRECMYEVRKRMSCKDTPIAWKLPYCAQTFDVPWWDMPARKSKRGVRCKEDRESVEVPCGYPADMVELLERAGVE